MIGRRGTAVRSAQGASSSAHTILNLESRVASSAAKKRVSVRPNGVSLAREERVEALRAREPVGWKYAAML